MVNGARGRPRRFSEYDQFVEGLPKLMDKRPKYIKGIGVFRGARGDTVWVKIRLPHGGTYNGKSYAPKSTLEIKLGDLSSWSWEQLEGKHTKLQGRADRGELLDDVHVHLFKDWADDWLRRAKDRLRAYATAKANVKNQFVPAFGDMALHVIATKDINNWVGQRLKKAKPATVSRELGTLSSILGSAVKSGYVDVNPCANADKIRGITGRQRFLSGEELVRLLIAAEDTAEWLPDFIVWAIHSGMRKSEICNLTWKDIQSLPDGRHIASIRTSKSDQPRMVVCTHSMVEVLDRQNERRQEGNRHVFTVTKMTLRRKWEKARRDAGLLDVTMHDLRRTHSTHAAAAGVDLNTLAGRIGHTDLSMLQKHYAAIVGSASAEAADTIQQVFDGITKVNNA